MIFDKNEILKQVKEFYYFEIEQKSKLDLKVKLPLTILFVLFGVVAYFIQNLSYFPNNLVTLVFYFLFILCVIFLIITCVFLIKSFHGYDYDYMPTGTLYENDIEKIKNYYKDSYFNNLNNEQKNDLIDNDIYQYLYDNFIDCINTNFNSNFRKNKMLFRTNIFLIISVVLLFLSSIPFVATYNIRDDVIKVQIQNPQNGEIEMTTEENNDQTQNEPQPPPKPSLSKPIRMRDSVIGSTNPNINQNNTTDSTDEGDSN